MTVTGSRETSAQEAQPVPALMSTDHTARAFRRRSTGSSQELADGQMVIVTARWILVVAGLLLTLWDPGTVQELRIHILLLLLLAVGNFYLHAQLLMRRPAVDTVAYAASGADILVIALLLIAQGGAASHLYIFFFPAILAFSVAFSTALTGAFVGAVMLLYAAIGFYDDGTTALHMQAMTIRLLMFAAVAMCGNTYWRIERNRRQVAIATLQLLEDRLQNRDTHER